MIWLHWQWVEVASVGVPIVVTGAALRIAGVSWRGAAAAATVAGLATYVVAHELRGVWLIECIAENQTPPPPSWPWSPRREFCDAGSQPALGGFALLFLPTVAVLLGALLWRTRLRPVGGLAYAALLAVPWLPDLYVSALPYYRLDEYPILHSPSLVVANGARSASACYTYGVAYGPRRPTVADPDERSTCVEFEPTRQAQSLTYSYDGGRTDGDLEQVGKNLTERGLPVRPGDTGVEGLVVARAYELSPQQMLRRELRARATDRRASGVAPGDPDDCGGGLERADPADDLADTSRLFPPQGVPSPDPRVDLQAWRLRAEDGRLCVAYVTSADLHGPMRFTFNLRDIEDVSRFVQEFRAYLREDGKVSVVSGRDERGHTLYVPADVGVEGNVFTLVLDGRSFQRGRPMTSTGADPPLDQFAFMGDVRVRLAGRRRLRDSFGPVAFPQAYRYPDGGRCRSEVACPETRPAPLSPDARRTRAGLTQMCRERGGRLTRRASELACVVFYARVPYDIPFNLQTGRLDSGTVRASHTRCRYDIRAIRQAARIMADVRQRPVRTVLHIWHPKTAVCEARPKGLVVRP